MAAEALLFMLPSYGMDLILGVRTASTVQSLRVDLTCSIHSRRYPIFLRRFISFKDCGNFERRKNEDLNELKLCA
jgi:hypothetical protein